MENRLRYGHATTHETKWLTLWWRSVRLDASTIDDTIKALEKTGVQGVYAFEGCHDAHPHGAVLYIGQNDEREGTLGARIRQSLRLRFRYKDAQSGEALLFSRSWEVTLRWAIVAEGSLRAVAERVLIATHAPPLNAQSVDTFLAADDPLVIINAGDKGRLLPILSNVYYAKAGWFPSIAPRDP